MSDTGNKKGGSEQCKHRIWNTVDAKIEGRGSTVTGVVQECSSCGALRFQERALVEGGDQS